jgi:hypothetical protein
MRIIIIMDYGEVTEVFSSEESEIVILDFDYFDREEEEIDSFGNTREDAEQICQDAIDKGYCHQEF